MSNSFISNVKCIPYRLNGQFVGLLPKQGQLGFCLYYLSSRFCKHTLTVTFSETPTINPCVRITVVKL